VRGNDGRYHWQPFLRCLIHPTQSPRAALRGVLASWNGRSALWPEDFRFGGCWERITAKRHTAWNLPSSQWQSTNTMINYQILQTVIVASRSKKPIVKTILSNMIHVPSVLWLACSCGCCISYSAGLLRYCRNEALTSQLSISCPLRFLIGKPPQCKI